MRRLRQRIWYTAFLLSILTGAMAPATARANVCLETIGGFGGSYIHMTYGYIGAIADAFAKDIYKPDQVKGMMEETVNYLDHLGALLKKLQDTNLAESDKKFVASLIEIINLLKTEAKSLAQFAVSRNPADVQTYDQARENAWQKIKQLLEMK